MTQPLDRSCKIPARGALDTESGEFWVENAFEMPSQRQNLGTHSERNKLYLSHQAERFIDLSNESGADIDSDSRSVVVADFDRDNAPDLLVASVGGGPLRLFLNRIPQELHRVRIELVGTKSSRRGTGARVVAQLEDHQIVRDLFPANGFMGQSPMKEVLGLGSAKAIERLRIAWPSGESQAFPDVPADCIVRITEGSQELEVKPLHIAERGR